MKSWKSCIDCVPTSIFLFIKMLFLLGFYICLHHLLHIPSYALSVPYSNFIPYASCLVSYGVTIGLPTVKPSFAPTAPTAINPYVWSVVPEPAALGIKYFYNSIQSAAWSSASTVVAVGNVQTTSNGLILRSTTGGLSWTLLAVSTAVSLIFPYISDKCAYPCSFICPLIHSLTYSFTHSFTYSLIYLYYFGV